MSSDPPGRIQAYCPDLGGCIVTGSLQAGSCSGLSGERQADAAKAVAEYEAEAGQ